MFGPLGDDLNPPDGESHRSVQDKILLDEVLEALVDLGNRCQELLVLYAYGHKVSEIAMKLRMPMGTVATRMQRCRELLLERLSFEWE